MKANRRRSRRPIAATVLDEGWRIERAKGEIVSPRPSLVDFSFDLRRLRTRRQPRRSFDPWWKDREETKRNSLLEREKERVLIGRMDNRLLWRWSCNLILYIGYILYIVKSLCDINGYVFTIKKKKGKKKKNAAKNARGGIKGGGGDVRSPPSSFGEGGRSRPRSMKIAIGHHHLDALRIKIFDVYAFVTFDRCETKWSKRSINILTRVRYVINLFLVFREISRK